MSASAAQPSTQSEATAESFSSGFSSSSSYPPHQPAAAATAQQHPACSACKHQRRKCAPGCLLAPYFPADRPGSFKNSHRLFGIKNILRFLKRAGPEQRDDCMKSMLYEADARAADPVLGSYGILQRLDAAHRHARDELEAVQSMLASYRAAAQHGTPPNPPPYVASPEFTFPPPVQPWMPLPGSSTLPHTIPEDQQPEMGMATLPAAAQPSYHGHVPSGGAKIEERATIDRCEDRR